MSTDQLTGCRRLPYGDDNEVPCTGGLPAVDHAGHSVLNAEYEQAVHRLRLTSTESERKRKSLPRVSLERDKTADSLRRTCAPVGPRPPVFTASSRSIPDAQTSTDVPPVQASGSLTKPGSYLLTAAFMAWIAGTLSQNRRSADKYQEFARMPLVDRIKASKDSPPEI
jgi:hypothetical protein